MNVTLICYSNNNNIRRRVSIQHILARHLFQKHQNDDSDLEKKWRKGVASELGVEETSEEFLVDVSRVAC